MNDVFALVQDPAFALAHRVRDPGTARPTSLLLLLHGVGGNETNLAGLAAGIEPDVLVVLPRGPLTLGNAQHAWFRVAFTGEGPQIVAEEAEASRQTLVRFIAQLQAAYGIAPARTLIAGFSQGGILSASVGLTAPASVAGFAVLSGRILPELEPLLAPPGQLAHVQALVAHGRNDMKLPVSWAGRAGALLRRLGVAHVLRLYPGGHGPSDAMARDFLDWTHATLAMADGSWARADAVSATTMHRRRSVAGALAIDSPLHNQGREKPRCPPSGAFRPRACAPACICTRSGAPGSVIRSCATASCW